MAKWRSKQDRGKLTKTGLKFMFKHKMFTILIATLVMLTGAAYTLLVSANDSFKSSFNQIVKDGQLHDYVVKENFKPDSSSTFRVTSTSSTNSIYEPEKAINKNIVKQSASYSADRRTGTLEIEATGLTGDYVGQNPELLKTKIIFNNLDDGNFDPEYSIIKDKINAFKSRITYAVEKGLSDKFVKTLQTTYGNKLDVNNNRSISVSADEKSFNVVQYNRNTKVNKMFIYDGTERFTNSLTKEQMEYELRARIAEQGHDFSDYTIESLKGFKVNARDAVGNAISITDPSSYQAIISPAYANRNNKRSISTQAFVELFAKKPNFMEELAKSDELKEKYKSNLVWVDKTPYFIIGIGTTPDYLYPIVDQEHPVLDVANQAVIYVNKRGYERIYDGFRTNPKEEYISLKFKPGISNAEKNHIVAEIEYLAHNGVLNLKDVNGKPVNDANGQPIVVHAPRSAYPQNIRMVTSSRDRNDQLLLTQERVVFLSDIENTIQSITYATTTLLIAFLISIVALVFQMVISIDRKRLATQLALGHPKWKIALSRTLISLFVGAIPTMIGYMIGFGAQFWFIQHFDNYWTIPTFGSSFSPLAFSVVVATPFTLISLIIFVITLWVLRRPITEMLSAGGNSSSNDFLAKIISGIKVVGVKGRYVTALMVKNSFKLFLLTIAATISISTLTIGMSSIGKADRAYSATVAMNNYEFEVNLYSPTKEGGYYSTQDYYSEYTTDEHGNRVLAKHPDGTQVRGLGDLYHGATYDGSGQPNSANDIDGNVLDVNKPHWHVPSTGDATYGMASTAANDLATSATYLKHKLQTQAILDTGRAGNNPNNLPLNPWDMARRLMPDNQRNKAEENNSYIFRKAEDDHLSNPSAFDALKNTLKEKGDTRHVPYVISYGDVVVDKGDEKYTYIDSNIGEEHYNIIGVNKNTNMISLGEDMSKLNNFKGNEIPVLINKYIEEKLKLDVGSKFEININNDFERNDKSFKGNKKTAKVVGIVDGYDNKGIYTLQSKANEALHMDSTKGFNGIFTKHKNPAILSTLPLYSPSGLWLGTDTIVGQWENVLDQILHDSSIWKHPSVAASTTEFFEKYSRTPFVGATSNVLWNEISKYTFKNTSELSSFIISMIEAMAITVSIIFTAIIAALLLISNKKKIASLWTMGYRKREIGLMFLSTYIVPAIISMAIAIPSAYALLIALKQFIMAFGNILIPFTLDWWSPIVAVASISMIFVGATFGAIVMQKQSKALEAFKED